MSAVVNQILDMDGFDMHKAAKYMRCMFQAVLPLDDDMAYGLLMETVEVLRKGASEVHRCSSCLRHWNWQLIDLDSQIDRTYPDEEVQWLVAKSWNHATALYQLEKDDLCQNWAAATLDLAHCSRDGGVLAAEIRSKYALFRFGI